MLWMTDWLDTLALLTVAQPVYTEQMISVLLASKLRFFFKSCKYKYLWMKGKYYAIASAKLLLYCSETHVLNHLRLMSDFYGFDP